MTTLADLRDAVATALNYDPTNAQYETELNGLINRAQTKVLGSHRWSFAQRDSILTVYPDTPFLTISITSGDTFVDLPALTGDARAAADGHTLYLTSSTGVDSQSYTISFADLASDRVYLTRAIVEATGTYTVTVQYREINLPYNASSVEGLLDLSVGIPEPQRAMSKLNRDVIRLDPNTTGRSLYFIPSSSIRVPPPRNVSGSAVVVAAAQGVRTLFIYQTFVWAGRESALSAHTKYDLTAVETLTFTAPAISTTTGYYRNYYYTCPDEGIKRPVFIGTTDPLGGVTLTPNLSLTTITSEATQANAVLYQALGQVQRFNLWPQPALVTQYQVRVQVLPQPMIEDGDPPLIPPDAAQVIEYEAAHTSSLRLDNPALGKMYKELRDSAFRQMSQTYLMQSTAPVVMLGASGSTKGPISMGPYRLIP
jgi:hypothetical protein